MVNANSFLADGLDRLLGLSLASSADLAVWYEQADCLHSDIERRFSEFELPHFLYHFFSDADIRARDAEYGEWQGRLVREYIESLRTASPDDQQVE